MDRGGNYFLVNDEKIGLSPLKMLGLSALHPKAMQQSFVGVSMNTHTVESDFSLFSCKDQETDLINLKNNLLNHSDTGLPVGNGFSKLIGGFIGSKCLVGLSANRGNNFWGRVLQQYNSIVSSNSQSPITVPTTKTKKTAGEYIEASAIDAAVLISHSFGLFEGNSFNCDREKMNTAKNLTLSPSFLDSFSCTQVQESLTVAPKQSYAEVAKSLSVSKLTGMPVCNRNSTSNRRVRSVRRNTTKFRQKKENSAVWPQAVPVMSPHNWRNRDDCNIFKKHGMDNRKHKESRSPQRPGYCDSQQRCPSTRGAKVSDCTSTDYRTDQLRASRVKHSPNRKNTAMRRKGNSDLLTDIKEDCFNVVNDCQKNEMKCDKHQYSQSSGNNLSMTIEKLYVPNHCQNWRCRPYESLCNLCKTKVNSCDTYPENCVSRTPDITVACEIEGEENDLEGSVSKDSKLPFSELEIMALSSRLTVCPDSSSNEEEIVVDTSCPFVRTRISSECSVDSEDSFVIMFDESGTTSDDEKSLETQFQCGDNDSSDESDTSSISNDDNETSSISSDDDVDDDASSISSQCSNLTYEESSGNDEVDLECVTHPYHCNSDYIEIDNLEHISENKLSEANARWRSAYENVPSAEKDPKKVQFARSPELAVVHPIVAWNFAYRAARTGPWEQLARDRVRFHSRIKQLNEVLEPVLAEDHRRRVWQKLHAEARNVP